MKIGYLPTAREAAEKMRLDGADLETYVPGALYDAILYSGTMEGLGSDAAQDTGLLDPAEPAAPALMLDLNLLDEAGVRRALRDRAQRKPFA